MFEPKGAPLTGIRELKTIFNNGLALKRDGSVIAWGENSSGQGEVPKNLDKVIAIAVAPARSLALRDDGTLMIWGDQSSPHDLSVVPLGLSNVTQIAVSIKANYAITTNRAVAVLFDADPR